MPKSCKGSYSHTMFTVMSQIRAIQQKQALLRVRKGLPQPADDPHLIHGLLYNLLLSFRSPENTSEVSDHTHYMSSSQRYLLFTTIL